MIQKGPIHFTRCRREIMNVTPIIVHQTDTSLVELIYKGNNNIIHTVYVHIVFIIITTTAYIASHCVLLNPKMHNHTCTHTRICLYGCVRTKNIK